MKRFLFVLLACSGAVIFSTGIERLSLVYAAIPTGCVKGRCEDYGPETAKVPECNNDLSQIPQTVEVLAVQIRKCNTSGANMDANCDSIQTVAMMARYKVKVTINDSPARILKCSAVGAAGNALCVACLVSLVATIDIPPGCACATLPDVRAKIACLIAVGVINRAFVTANCDELCKNNYEPDVCCFADISIEFDTTYWDNYIACIAN